MAKVAETQVTINRIEVAGVFRLAGLLNQNVFGECRAAERATSPESGVAKYLSPLVDSIKHARQVPLAIHPLAALS